MKSRNRGENAEVIISHLLLANHIGTNDWRDIFQWIPL